MSGTLARRPIFRPLIAAATAAVVLVGGTLLLWAHYGAAVFFETIRAGFTACFG